MLALSEDSYSGEADLTRSIYDEQVTTPQPVTTLHKSGKWEDFMFAGDFGAGERGHVAFAKDAFSDLPTTNRNPDWIHNQGSDQDFERCALVKQNCCPVVSKLHIK
jgi:hypothetical protein